MVVFGDLVVGCSDVMNVFVVVGMIGGGEGIDFDFVFDIILNDGDIIDGLIVLYMLGYMGNYICFFMGIIVFIGDYVMDWVMLIVLFFDGDLIDFMVLC